jgi:PhzF family phenazine biosynthesis protein
MSIPIYHVDAFTNRVFHGNPAGVCPLDRWLDDAAMQAIAAENNLSETAFFVRRGNDYDLRWFTPATEVDLCGHATLASAHVLFTRLDRAATSVTFHTRSGPLTVTRDGDRLVMDFPSRPPAPCPIPAGLVDGLGGGTLRETLKARDLLAVFDDEEAIRRIVPDFAALERVDAFGIIVTARGREVDFVSRFFAPRQGVPEDPVTGSAHCTLVPYWAGRLGRTRLSARQVSARGGEIACELAGDRVRLAGHAVVFMEGTLQT